VTDGDRRCVRLAALADREHVDASLGQLDGGPQPCPAGADHQDGRRDLMFLAVHRRPCAFSRVPADAGTSVAS
jgi:hypothetical protein